MLRYDTQPRLRALGLALNTVLPGVFVHYFRTAKTAPWGVWQEDGEAQAFNANNRKQEQPLHGTLDYFTHTEYDPAIDLIGEALDKTAQSWGILSVQHEEETKLIHYEWEWVI